MLFNIRSALIPLLLFSTCSIAQSIAPPNELIRDMQGDNRNARRSATQLMVWYYKDDVRAIQSALSLLEGQSAVRLSGPGRINLLYFLSGTYPSAWDEQLRRRGVEAAKQLERYPYGPQTKGYIADFADLVNNFPAPKARAVQTAAVQTVRPNQYQPKVPDKYRGAVRRPDRAEQFAGLPNYSSSVALLLGVSNYDDREWNDLDSVPSEMRKLKAALETRGFDVTSLADPTGDQIRDSVRAFTNKHGFDEEAQLLIFFAGHGYTRKTREGIEKGYIVPRDTPGSSNPGFRARAISMEEVTSWAKRIESKHALFMFDSCFAGSIFETRSAAGKLAHIRSATEKPVRYFITSGSANERVPSQSSFVDYLIDALAEDTADMNGDFYTTSTELGIYLNEKVLNLGQGQTPQFGKILDSKLDDGDFVFFPL